MTRVLSIKKDKPDIAAHVMPLSINKREWRKIANLKVIQLVSKDTIDSESGIVHCVNTVF